MCSYLLPLFGILVQDTFEELRSKQEASNHEQSWLLALNTNFVSTDLICHSLSNKLLTETEIASLKTISLLYPNYLNSLPLSLTPDKMPSDYGVFDYGHRHFSSDRLGTDSSLEMFWWLSHPRVVSALGEIWRDSLQHYGDNELIRFDGISVYRKLSLISRHPEIAWHWRSPNPDKSTWTINDHIARVCVKLDVVLQYGQGPAPIKTRAELIALIKVTVPLVPAYRSTQKLHRRHGYFGNPNFPAWRRSVEMQYFLQTRPDLHFLRPYLIRRVTGGIPDGRFLTRRGIGGNPDV